ncbi:hypothetical protein KKF03_03615 [Patescibacteria group bacterium]|nr:hypothetical protein [Patescibacteria group bacterium]
MNTKTSKLRHVSTGVGLLIGSTMFAFALLLLLEHIMVLKEVKMVSVPLVAKLAELERREDALREQVELSQIQAATKVGSLGEKLDINILPKETDFDRLIAAWDLYSDWLRNQGLVSEMSDITFGDPVILEEEGVTVRPMRVSYSAHEDGIKKLLIFTQLAGLLTVSDALTDEEIQILFESTEKENPVGIVALEQFLSSDLLRYSRDVRSYEEQLKRSFNSTEFANLLESVSEGSLLGGAYRIFGGEFGKTMSDGNPWPIQFMTLREVSMEEGGVEGWYRVGLEMLVWER